MAITIAGGVYLERCLTPSISALFGSAGRAAAALSALSDHVTLHSFFPTPQVSDAQFAFAAYGVEAVFHPSPTVVGFEYLHPMSSPRIWPIPLPWLALSKFKASLSCGLDVLKVTFAYRLAERCTIRSPAPHHRCFQATARKRKRWRWF
jgi:hypothetical protein